MVSVAERLSDERFEGMVLLDGLDAAFIGVTDSQDGGVFSAVYDIDKIIQVLGRDMGFDDAWEWFNYNMAGQYVGDQSPVFIRTLDEITL